MRWSRSLLVLGWNNLAPCFWQLASAIFNADTVSSMIGFESCHQNQDWKIRLRICFTDIFDQPDSKHLHHPRKIPQGSWSLCIWVSIQLHRKRCVLPCDSPFLSTKVCHSIQEWCRSHMFYLDTFKKQTWNELMNNCWRFEGVLLERKHTDFSHSCQAFTVLTDSYNLIRRWHCLVTLAFFKLTPFQMNAIVRWTWIQSWRYVLWWNNFHAERGHNHIHQLKPHVWVEEWLPVG